MNTTEIKLKQLDTHEEQLKAAVKLGAALERLKRNKDYQLVIEKGYLIDNAVRLVHLKGDPSQFKPEMQSSIIREIDAISSFVEFTRMVLRDADNAEQNLPNIEDVRAQIIEEGE